MQKKRIAILGGGISGLSAAWYLSQGGFQNQCTLIEKQDRAGGWMGSSIDAFFSVEKGPRIFKTSRNLDFLQWIEDMDLAESIITSSPHAEARYLWKEGALHKMPSGLFSLCTSSLSRPLLLSLLRERSIPPVTKDETIWDFACRRFGRLAAERFFDPLVLGIYAGDCKKLSVEACFPVLKGWEKEHGSIIRAMFAKGKKKQPLPFKASLFSFIKGTGPWVEECVEKIPAELCFGQEIVSLKRKTNTWQIHSSEKTWEAEEVVLATPSYTAAKLLRKEAPQSAEILSSISYEDVTTIHLGWKGRVLPFSAFGYLIPSSEKSSILGVLFDSEMFGKEDNTLITIMIKGTFHVEKKLEEIASHVREHHLKITKKPDYFSFSKKSKAIPQYVMGHIQKKQDLRQVLSKEAPHLHLVGNYLDGVSVNDCIRVSKELAMSLAGNTV